MDPKSDTVLKDKKKLSLYFKAHGWTESTNEDDGLYVTYTHNLLPMSIVADYIGKRPKYILSSFGKKNFETSDFNKFIEGLGQ